jgi:AraC-like DNA-binding protein
MRIEDLARTVGMSTAAFHRHFRAITTMSPLQFQKRIRLGRPGTRPAPALIDPCGV